MREKLLFIAIFFILTLFNLNKAFHIDDTFHLEAARWIADNPYRPMSGLINWQNDPTPIYSHNQPPLFFYLVALMARFFGYYAIPLHLLISVFTFLSLYFFVKMTRALELKQANLMLLLFGFCPALIVNQNVMTDIPILALILGSSYYLLKADSEHKAKNYCFTSLLLSAGLLIKYSLLPLVIVIFAVMVIRRDFKYLIIAMLPILFLGLWSTWNYYEYGSVHMLDRPKSGISIGGLWSYWAGLGSIGLFSLVFLYGMLPKNFMKWLILTLLTSYLILLTLFFCDFISESITNNFLRINFLILGAVGFLLPFYLIFKYWYKVGFQDMIASKAMVLFLYFGALSSFVILFAPFIATRHILLAVPFIILISATLIYSFDNLINKSVVLYSVILSLFLATTDWQFANFYRSMADQALGKVPKAAQVWSAGHWGWQWYSASKGMKLYSTNHSKLGTGDYLIYPVGISKQEFEKDLQFSSITKLWEKPSVFNVISVSRGANMYNSSVQVLPWRLSKLPIDTVYVCKIR